MAAHLNNENKSISLIFGSRELKNLNLKSEGLLELFPNRN